MGKETNISTEKGQQKKEKTPRRLSLTWNIAGMIAAVALLVALLMLGLNVYTHHGEEITIPDLKGLSVSQATLKLKSMGLEASVEDSVYFKQLPANTVYSQNLPAGAHVKSGRIVRLTINTAQPPMVTLPDLADNSSEREATMKLLSLGLKMSDPERVKGEKDWVYGVKVGGRNVTAGMRIPSDATVTLVVGDGTFYTDDVEEVEDFNPNDSLEIIDDAEGDNMNESQMGQ